MLINTITPNSLLSPLCAIDGVYIGNETYSFTREKNNNHGCLGCGKPRLTVSKRSAKLCMCVIFQLPEHDPTRGVLSSEVQVCAAGASLWIRASR